MATSNEPGSSQATNLEQLNTGTTLDGTNREYYDSNQGNGNFASVSTQAQQQEIAAAQAGYWGYGPLARIDTTGERLPAFGGDFQPGLYKPPGRKFGNPAPLGLAGFALTTFLLSLVNLGTCGITSPSLVLAPAFAYGGLIQLLAGMWEFAQNNTFGATALSSYGGFWISLGIILTPGGFEIAESYGGENYMFYQAFGLYLISWFIFTFILWLCTIRSTVAFSSLFFFVWLTFLMLGCSYLDSKTVNSTTATPNVPLTRAGGAFGIIAGIIAWWNMLAGLLEPSNSFFLIPVFRFPWSEEARAARNKEE